jgi:hypothetical protein
MERRVEIREERSMKTDVRAVAWMSADGAAGTPGAACVKRPLDRTPKRACFS